LTLVVGVEHLGHIYMAGDAGIHQAKLRYVDTGPKLINRSGFLIGVAGNARVCDVILEWKPPKPYRTNARKWIITTFVPEIKKVIDGEPPELLLGIRGELFSLDTEYGLARVGHGYDAIGSAIACGVAFGNLEATKKLGPKQRLRSALSAAAKRTNVVVPPWTFINN
jgi:hypothetical protein